MGAYIPPAGVMPRVTAVGPLRAGLTDLRPLRCAANGLARSAEVHRPSQTDDKRQPRLGPARPDASPTTRVFEVAHFCPDDSPTDPALVDAGLKTTRKTTRARPFAPPPPRRAGGGGAARAERVRNDGVTLAIMAAILAATPGGTAAAEAPRRLATSTAPATRRLPPPSGSGHGATTLW